MFTLIWVVGGFILVAALVGLVYLASQHGKGDETGRRERVDRAPATPKRTEGRET